MIGERIKQGRTALGLTTRALAELVGVSAMAISKYENNRNTPSSDILIALANALNVRVEYFFRTSDITLQQVEHRKHHGLPEKEHKKVIADVVDQIERRVELGRFMPEAWQITFNRPKPLPKQIKSFDEIEVVAEKVRQYWNLGGNPIPDLIDTLEEQGIKVFTSQFGVADRFDGLSATVDNMPVIVVGTGNDWVGDRQRFTLAHELGHLLLNGRLPDDWDDQTVENACNRFAGAFIAPATEVIKALGNNRSWLEPQELMQLKQEYGLSMGGWTYRARDLGIISQQVMSKLWKLFREQGWKVCEPEPQYPREIARRFTQLVYHALAEDQIGESKAAELLGQALVEFRACRLLNCPPMEGGKHVADQ